VKPVKKLTLAAVVAAIVTLAGSVAAFADLMLFK
jgi:outer membrane murein-binding lipoprotein Lpp